MGPFGEPWKGSVFVYRFLAGILLGPAAGTASVQFPANAPSLGNAIVTITDGTATSEVVLTNIEPLTIQSMAGFEATGPLPVGDDTLTLSLSSPANLGSATPLAGGTINAPGGIALSAGVLASIGVVAGIGNLGCRGCVACIGCVDCEGCVGCIGCVGLRGAVGEIGRRG